MPPKAARGTAAWGRPRGRGGGRSMVENDMSQPEAETGSSQSMSSFPPINASAKSTPTRRNANDEAPHSPNTSPATMPTETPAPTPIRAPPTFENDPSSRSPHGAAPKMRGRGNAATSRFRPRNIRRDQSERDKLAEQERARIAEIQKVEEARAKKAAAERARKENFSRDSYKKRGHGEMMGRPNREPERLVASGPFSAAAPSEPRIRRSVPGVGGHSGGGGGGGGGRGSGGGGGRRGSTAGRVKSETTVTDALDQAPVSGNDSHFSESDHVKEEGDPGPMKNIDFIDLVSSDEDANSILSSQQKGKGKAKSNQGGLRPIRAMRQAHKSPTRTAYSVGSVKNETDESEVEERQHGEVIDVEMGGVDEAEMEIDEPESLVPLPAAPRRGPSSKIDGKAAKPQQLARQPTKKKKKKKEKKPVLQTREDLAEQERQMHELQVLKRELADVRIQTQYTEGDLDMSTPAEKNAVDKKEGRLYLFQFPPVLPELYNPVTQKPKSLEKEKEKVGANEDDDVEMTGENIDLTTAKDEGLKDIKLEPGVDADGTQQREPFVTEEGFIGKLIVRQSGRAELDWGGTHMLVNTGTADNFTSSVVLADEGEGGKEGTAMGMGKVFGRFVVTPDWESLF